MATVTGTKRHLGITSNTYDSNGDVVVGGNLTINGTTTTLDTANLLVEDKNIIIGNVTTPSDTTADGGGITLKGASDYTINWSNTNNRWDFNQGIHSSGNVTGANLSGTNTGDNSANTHSSLFIDRGGIDVTTSSGGSNTNPFDDAHTETKVAENGMRTLNYTGASAFMYTFNNGGSASVVQIGAHYNGDDYYLRTRTDSSSWKTWKKIRTFGNTTLPTDFVSAANGGTFSGALIVTDALAEGSPILDLHNSTNGNGVDIRFTDVAAGTTQFGNIIYRHQDSKSYGSAAGFIIGTGEASLTVLADGKLMYNEGIYSKPATGTGAGTRKDSNWDDAYTHSTSTHAPTDAEANVQSDWNATSGDALILNKPSIPTDFVSAANGGTFSGGLTINGSIDSGGTNMGYYESVGTNLILKGDSVGRSGIFFESEKDGTNINDPSDYGFIQFHSYGYGNTSGEANNLVIGVSNDSTDKLILQAPYNGGVMIGYKDATSGTGLTLSEVIHSNAGSYNNSNWDDAYTHSTSTHAPTDAEANVQADWDETTDTDDAYIKNKPPIPTDFVSAANGGTFSAGITISNTFPFLDFVDTNSFTDADDKFRVRAGANQGLLQWYDNSAGSTQTIMSLDPNGDVDIVGDLTADNFSGTSSGTNTGDQTLSGLGGVAEGLLHRQTSSANSAALGAGWITVATNTSGRKHGEVIVSDSESGDHAFIRIDWMRSYADSNFSVLNVGGHANQITGVRVLSQDSDNTYGIKKLQVQVGANSVYGVRVHTVGSPRGYGSHTAVAATAVENTITGYTVHGKALTGLSTATLAAEEGIKAGGIIESDSGVTAKGPILTFAGAGDQNTNADSTSNPSTTTPEYQRISYPSSYTDGRFTHEWAKIDRGGNLPLYLRQSKTTANTFTNLARFGDHSYSSHEFEVFGSIKATGGDSGQWNTGYTTALAALPKVGGTITGNLQVNGYIRGNGQQLVLNAGEAHSYATGQTNEFVYVNAEQGLEVNSETGNWASGWAARKTALLRGDLLRLDGEDLNKQSIIDLKKVVNIVGIDNNRSYTLSLGAFTGKRYYKIASVNRGSGGLRISGIFTNHVGAFGSSKVDVMIQGRGDGSNDDITITGNFNSIASGSGILVVLGSTSGTYDEYDVYVVASQYQQVELNLQYHNATMTLETSSYVTSVPTGTDGHEHLNTSRYNEGSYNIEDKIVSRDGESGKSNNLPNRNLLVQSSIELDTVTDIAGNATYNSTFGKFKRKYANDNTGNSNMRLYCDLADLTSGEYYMVSVYYEDLVGTLSLDWCDETPIGPRTVTSTSHSGEQSRGRLYGYAKKGTYNSTYRFMDVTLTQGSGNRVTLYHPKVEEGMLLTDFLPYHDSRVDMDEVTATAAVTHKIYAGSIDTDMNNGLFKVHNSGDPGLLLDCVSGTFKIGDYDGIADESYIQGLAEEVIVYIQGNETLEINSTNTSVNSKLRAFSGANFYGSAAWNETTPGTAVGSIHLDPNSVSDHRGGAITFGASDHAGGADAQAGIYTRTDGTYGSKMYFATTDSYTAGSKVRMSIGHNGNVAIGAAPHSGVKFWVEGDAYVDGLQVGNSAVAGSTSIFAVNSVQYITTHSGKAINIGGGPGNLQNNLQVRNGNLRVYSGAIGVNVAPSATDGRIDAGNDVVAYSSSDKRWKENIVPIGNALEKLSKIRGVSFDWKELTTEEKKTQHSNEGHDIGVIAQEVEAVLPEIVTTRENGYKGVKYEKIVPLLIESIKELQAEVNKLKKQIN